MNNKKMIDKSMRIIGIVGLGYTRLSLGVAFGQKRPVIGFDINQNRISELNKGFDRTLECDSEVNLDKACLLI